MSKVKVPIIFSSIEGFPPRRDGHYFVRLLQFHIYYIFTREKNELYRRLERETSILQSSYMHTALRVVVVVWEVVDIGGAHGQPTCLAEPACLSQLKWTGLGQNRPAQPK